MSTRVVTPFAILSYPALFTPKKNNREQDQYSAELVFTPELLAESAKRGFGGIDTMQEAVRAAIADKWGTAPPKGLRLPFDDRWGRFGYPEDSVFVRSNSIQRPGIVKGPSRTECTESDAKDFYAGAIVVAELNANAYDWQGNRGVKFYLNSIWKIRDGEPLVAERAAGAAFEGTDLDADAFGSAEVVDSLL